jgi:NADH-quinone oxidoreductase subunit N
MIHPNDFVNIVPILIIAITGLLTIIAGIVIKKEQIISLWICISGVILALISSFAYLTKEIVTFNDFIKINGISISFSVIIYVSFLITFLSSKSYLEREEINYGEYYTLLAFALLGMQLMVFANDLLIVFLGLELMSICFYVLAGFLRKRIKSNESALKYFLLGAFMTGFLLYGISLIYGITGTTNITKIITNTGVFKNTVFLVGASFFIIGFFFKMGIFPFQMWIPDVYEGSPTIVSGMMSTSGKIAAVGTIAPIIIALNIVDFRLLLSILAVLTMLAGNIIALSQINIKRLLAYSSIASAGYIMVGIASMDDFALKGIAFYLLAYTFMQLGSFILVSIAEKSSENKKEYLNVNITDYKGLAKRNPSFAVFLTIFLFSLGGIPPFAGFWGKYYLFYAAIKSNLIWLSIVAILLSVVSIYYYLKIVVYMWFYDAGENPEKIFIGTLGRISIYIAILGTLLFGIYPQLFFSIFNMTIK